VDPEQFILRNEALYGNIDQESRDEITHQDGRIFDRYAAPVKSADGEYYGRVWYYRDITDRRKLEEQLRQSQKMEAVGQLAGGVAHNFNNMLTAIMGYAGLALETLGSDHPAEDDLLGIQATARRAAELTQQLLAFTRRQVVQPRVLNLNDLVSSVSMMLRQLIVQSIELDILPDPNLYQVKADPSQIEQVLVNLVINAQDAMLHGGRLSVKTSNVTFDQPHNGSYTEVQPGHYVLLVVSDTGIGISDDIRAHIFEPFFTTKDVGQGTGLGLATCFGIVKQNQGYIDVSSIPGRGTTFSVFLPRHNGPKNSEPETEMNQTLPAGSETVILVEDEEAVRDLAVRTLRGLGYTVIEAANGLEALTAVEQQAEQTYQLLVTDLVMPHMGGDELAKRLRSRYPSLKILFMSGYSDDGLVSKTIQEHRAVFLQKPFATAELVRKIRVALDGIE
jgi:signal transduction histidine kinase/CheY-like chemotaxis protein